MAKVENDYQKVLSEKPDSVTLGSPLIPNNNTNSLIKRYDEVIDYLKLSDIYEFNFNINENMVDKIIASLDKEGRWLIKGMQTSNPYIGEPTEGDPASKKYMTTFVGDKYDTSPYRDKSDQKYISTGVYTFNMRVLIKYLNKIKNGTANKVSN